MTGGAANAAARRGFTLVELLVVIAIMAIVATVTVTSIKGAQRQARSVKCQANMHTLYKAVMAYQAEYSHFPVAGAFEVYNDDLDRYSAYRGWVNWVRTSTTDETRSRRGDPGNLYGPVKSGSGIREGSIKSSQAAQYCFVGTGAFPADYTGATKKGSGYEKVALSHVYRSIDEGAIYIFADKNMSAYCCDEFRKLGRKGSYDCRLALRSYAMNRKYYTQREYDPNIIKYGTLWKSPENANRLAMFVELDESSLTGNKLTGTTTGKKADETGKGSNASEYFTDDAIWDWDSGENIGVPHYKSGHRTGHVVFADGHLETLERAPSKRFKQWPTAENQRISLGTGGYGE